MDHKNPGANFQIMVDGKSQSYRDAMATALEAGIFLKERHPQSEIMVRDLKSGRADRYRMEERQRRLAASLLLRSIRLLGRTERAVARVLNTTAGNILGSANISTQKSLFSPAYSW
jgi:hypothetical protein